MDACAGHCTDQTWTEGLGSEGVLYDGIVARQVQKTVPVQKEGFGHPSGDHAEIQQVLKQSDRGGTSK